MRWLRLAQPISDPFAFEKAVRKPVEGPKVTWPERRKWYPPLDPQDIHIPPPPQNRDAVVNEIVRMLSSATVEQAVALRDRLRGEGFWKGLMEGPKPAKAGETGEEPPFMAKSPPEPAEQAVPPEPHEGKGSPAIRWLRERFRKNPPPPARPTGAGPMTEYEERLRGQSSQ
jgi:hypothetical protein